MSSSASLPRHFRKLPQRERRDALAALLGTLPEELAGSGDTLALADLLIESSVGALPVPLGIAAGFLVDGEELAVPMATEEASVVAAASFAGRLLAAGGGIATESDPPLATEQIFVPVGGSVDQAADLAAAVRRAGETIREVVDGCLPSLVGRGGGFRGLDVAVVPLPPHTAELRHAIRAEVDIDVRDAMGANMVNTAGERLRPLMAELCGQPPLMAIVTNASPRSRVRARGRVPWSALGCRGHDGRVVAERIAAAAAVAAADRHRAVTHNKGVMNGVTAVVLATGNDTRAVEAAAHGWAAANADAGYVPLTTYRLAADAEAIDCAIELPVPLGTVGGTVDPHPVARMALRLLGSPDSRRLARIAAAAGLASNLAALRALVSEGIQPGHMRLHYARQAFAAGARGGEVEAVADLLAAAAAREEATDRNAAATMLHAVRAGTSGGGRR